MKYISKKYKIILFFACLPIIEITHAQDIHSDSCIVSFGYNYNLPEWMVTRAISSIDASNLDKSMSTNIGNKLQGRISGLTVYQTNNEPGLETNSLYSRGMGTYGTERKVLVIVDGFESTYDQLIPEEIESITLLKDAASATMYGMKGANGVLLITTKRGKEGPLKVSVSAQTGFESPLRLPDFLGSYDYATLYNEGLRNDGLPNQYSESDLNAYKSGNDPYFYPDVDWYGELLRKIVPTSNVNITFSGGKNNVRYFTLLSYKNRSGIYKNTADKTDFSINSKNSQFNIRSNVDIDLTKRLAVSLNMGFALANKSNPGAYNTNTIFNKMSLIPPNAFPVYNPDDSYGGNSLYTNPWADILETGFFTSNYRTSQTAIKLTHQLDMITEGLDISVAASVNNTFRGYSSKSRTYDRYSILRVNPENIDYIKFGEQTSLSSSEGSSDQWRNVSFQAFLNYNKSIGTNIIDASLGYDMNESTPLQSSTSFKHLGLNGRATYSHDMKYIGEFSFGYYGSNGYKRGKRFGFFPALSIGWIISNENFLKDNAVIDFLKLRASLGTSANNALGGARFRYEQYYHGQGTYIYGTSVMGGYAESYLANPDLTWEKKTEINFGMNVSFIDCIKFSLDLFSQNRYDILTIPEDYIPGFAGMLLLEQNIGKVNNKGFEATIGYNPKQTSDFNFYADLSIWFAKNKITRIPESIKEYEYQFREGRRIDQPFLLQDLGFFKNESDIANSPYQIFDIVQAGDIKYKDQNNDGIVDERDFYPIGYTNIPELSFGLNTGVQYKNLYLNVFFQGVTNRSVYLSGTNFHAFQNDAKVTSEALKRWTPNTQESASYPRLSSRNNMNNYQSSSFWQKNGGFARLKNVEVGYNLSTPLIRRIGINGATIFFNCANLLTLDHIKIADPEILTGYPNMRSFNIGAKIQL
jgi:TonB-linked SusC/RagA family outer membrane protein